MLGRVDYCKVWHAESELRELYGDRATPFHGEWPAALSELFELPRLRRILDHVSLGH